MTITLRLLLALLLIESPALAQEPVFAFTGATIIDGTGRPPIRDGTLIVSGERVIAVGPRSEVAIPDGATRRDMRGSWIIPGMIDAHVHLFESARPGAQPTFIADLRSLFPYDDEVAWMKRRAPFTLSRYICSGVTSVIVLGAIDWEYELRAVAAGMTEAPRLILAAGGFNNQPVAASYPIFDGEQTGRDATSPEQAVRLMNQLADRPSDLVKILFTPTAEYSWARFQPTFEALIRAAHARGLPVSVHALGLPEATAALAAGADNLAHPVRASSLDSAFLAAASRPNVTITSTMGSYVGYGRLGAERFELEPTERTCGDPEVAAAWERWTAIPVSSRPAYPPSYAMPERRLTPARATLRQAIAAGIAIAAGSDGGNVGTMHGPGFQRELRLLSELGLSPMDVILAATRNGARVAGMERELGTLQPGKLADFVVLEADPLADVANLDRITHIFVRGRMVERATLQAQR